jgi:GntR family histidine utilization transcriptional repressor
MPAATLANRLVDQPGPLYRKVKLYVLGEIQAGNLTYNQKLPSEQQLVAQFGVSRMTVHRALRELVSEGVIVRMPGVGTFVRQPRPRSASLELRDIREEIRARSNRHSCAVLKQELIVAGAEICELLNLAPRTQICHALILHSENDVPIQLEERFIVPEFADGFLGQDFTKSTLYKFLHDRSTPSEIEHVIQAIHSAKSVATLLKISEDQPVLRIRRRTWVEDKVAVLTYFSYPGDRYNVFDRHNVDPFASDLRRRNS